MVLMSVGWADAVASVYPPWICYSAPNICSSPPSWLDRQRATPFLKERDGRQSSSASRRTASHVGFLLLSQLAERPERTRRSQVHGARRPNKERTLGDSARRGRAPGYGDFANVEGTCGNG